MFNFIRRTDERTDVTDQYSILIKTLKSPGSRDTVSKQCKIKLVLFWGGGRESERERERRGGE